jgi:hypothetical protein
VVFEDDDRVGDGDVLVIEGTGFEVGDGASLTLRDADGTSGTLLDGENADFSAVEETGGGSGSEAAQGLRIDVTGPPQDVGGTGDDYLSTDGLTVQEAENVGRPETQEPDEGTEPDGSTGPETTGPETTTGPGEPEGGESLEGTPVEPGEESVVDVGDVLLLEGHYEAPAEGASLRLVDEDYTYGLLVDGENADFSSEEGALRVEVTGNVQELAGGDARLSLAGLTVAEAEGIDPSGGETTSPDEGTEPDEGTVPETTTPVDFPQTNPETTEPETTEPDEGTQPEDTQPEATDPESTEPETTGREEEPEACEAPVEIDEFTGSEGQVSGAFETTGGRFRLGYEVAAADDAGGGETGTAADPEASLAIGVLEGAGDEERFGEPVEVEGSGAVAVEAPPGVYRLELVPSDGASFKVSVEDCTGVRPEADPEDDEKEQPRSPDEIHERYGDPERIVKEEREEGDPPTYDGDTGLPTRLPDTGGWGLAEAAVAGAAVGLGGIVFFLVAARRGRWGA